MITGPHDIDIAIDGRFGIEVVVGFGDGEARTLRSDIERYRVDHTSVTICAYDIGDEGVAQLRHGLMKDAELERRHRQ